MRPQIVGDVARHLLQVFQQRADAVQHQVDGPRQSIQFVVVAGQGDAIVEAAGDDGVAGPGDGVDPPQELHAEQGTAGARQQDSGFRSGHSF